MNENEEIDYFICHECNSSKFRFFRTPNGSLWGRCQECNTDTEFGYWYENAEEWAGYRHDEQENIDWLVSKEESV